MAKKAAGSGLRSRQRVNVDFYRVTAKAGGPKGFWNALLEMVTRSGALRRTMVLGERIDVHHISRDGDLIEGELGRLRSHDIPSIAAEDCSTRAIPLKEKEAITERTAFLFDRKTAILALHVKREAVNASKIAALCDSILDNKEAFFELEIVLNPDAQAKFERMNIIKTFEVAYESDASGAIKHPDPTTKDFLEGFKKTGGNRIKIEVSSSRGKEQKLDFEPVRALLGKAEAARKEGVTQLKVTGVDAGDQRLAIDLIEDRMRAFQKIEVAGTSASYEQRRGVVRALYEQQRSKM